MKKVIYVVFILLLLIGCSKDVTKSQQLTDLLADVRDTEEQRDDAGKKLSQQEKKEQKLFHETVALTQQQYKEVKKQVAMLEQSVNERTSLVEKEEMSMNEAKLAIDQLSQSVKQMEDAQQLEGLVAALYERSDLHESFVLEYQHLIDSQTQLYKLLEDHKVRERELQKQVSEVNKLTESIQQSLIRFNEKTQEVNKLAALAVESLE